MRILNPKRKSLHVPCTSPGPYPKMLKIFFVSGSIGKPQAALAIFRIAFALGDPSRAIGAMVRCARGSDTSSSGIFHCAGLFNAFET